jgi:hypothetical protein
VGGQQFVDILQGRVGGHEIPFFRSVKIGLILLQRG